MPKTESIDLPGPSRTGDEVEDESLHSDLSKLRLEYAVLYSEKLLFENDLVAPESSTVITEEAMLMGEELCHNCVEMLGEMKLITEEELISINEIDEEGLFEEVRREDSSEDYEPEEKKTNVGYIPLDCRIKIVNIDKQHPDGSLKVLEKRGCFLLKYISDISRWERHIKSGGTVIEKFNPINSWRLAKIISKSPQEIYSSGLYLLQVSSEFGVKNF